MVVLLDNKYTMSLFCKKRLVKNIQKAKRLMTLKSNGGSMSVKMIADIGTKALDPKQFCLLRDKLCGYTDWEEDLG
jgi:hypothetical protein